MNDTIRAEPVGGGGEFWQRLASDGGFAERIGHGWLVASFDMPETWTTWEMHPDGDEIVYVRERPSPLGDRDR